MSSSPHQGQMGSKNVIVRFLNRKDATKTLLNRRNLQRCSELGYRNLWIYENLCPAFRSIYDNLKEEKEKGHISKMRTYNGVINYKLSEAENERLKRIHTLNDFKNLISKFGT